MTSGSFPVHESSEPSCVPLMPGRQYNTARPRHNFPILPLLCSKLLISEASYIMDYAMCFSVVYFSGPSTLIGLGAGCWWRRLLLTFTCSWKEPPAPILLLGSVRIKPKQANGRLGLEGPPPWRAHVSQKSLEKTGDTCTRRKPVCQLLHSLRTPEPGYCLLFWVLVFWKQHSKDGCTGHLVWHIYELDSHCLFWPNCGCYLRWI